MNPDAFVFVPAQAASPAKKNMNQNSETVKATKLTVDTSQGTSYDHEVVIQDAVCSTYVFIQLYISLREKTMGDRKNIFVRRFLS